MDFFRDLRNSLSRTHYPPRFPGHTYKEHAHDLFKDKVYDPQHWERHQSWRRHVPSFEITLRVILWYWPPLLFVSLVGVFVCLYNRFAQPAGAPDITTGNFQSPFLLSSFALGLLLVFRTQSAYQRWLEARTAWGSLLAVTRNLVLETYTFGSKDAEALKDMFARWVIMLPYCLRAHLSAEKDFITGAEGILDAEEEAWLGQQHCLPIAAVQVLTELLPRLGMPIYLMAQTFDELATYSRFLAACERIYRQPIPVAYTRHTSRFLIVWISTFPFALFANFSWFSPVVGAIVGFLLIGVENIGVQIEQPFAVLPLHGLCNTMRDNVQAMRKSGPAAQAFVRGLVAAELQQKGGAGPPADKAAPPNGAQPPPQRGKAPPGEPGEPEEPGPGITVLDPAAGGPGSREGSQRSGRGSWEGAGPGSRDGSWRPGRDTGGREGREGERPPRRSQGDLDYEVPSERRPEGERRASGERGFMRRLSSIGGRRPSLGTPPV